MAILILAIPLGVNLLKQQQIFQTRATVPPIVFSGPNVETKTDGTVTVVNEANPFVVELTSPFGTQTTTTYSYPTPSTAYSYPTPDSTYSYPSPATTYGYPTPETAYTYPTPAAVYSYPTPSTINNQTEAANWYVYLNRKDIRDFFLKNKGEAAGYFDDVECVCWVEVAIRENMYDWWSNYAITEKTQYSNIIAYATSLGMPSDFPSSGYPKDAAALYMAIFNARSDLQADYRNNWLPSVQQAYPAEANELAYMSRWWSVTEERNPYQVGGGSDIVQYAFDKGFLAALPSATADVKPTGSFTAASCTSMSGTATDSNFSSGSLQVDFWLLSSENSGLSSDAFLGSAFTNSSTQAFNLNPQGITDTVARDALFTGSNRTVRAYAINVDSTGTRQDRDSSNTFMHTDLGAQTVNCSSNVQTSQAPKDQGGFSLMSIVPKELVKTAYAQSPGTCRNLRPDETIPVSQTLDPDVYQWTALCSTQCTSNSQCPTGADGQQGWCYGFEGSTGTSADWRCLRLDRIDGGGTPGTAPACDQSQLTMTASPNPVNINNNITFSLSGSQGSTNVLDTWTGGVDCSGGFWGNKTCKATKSGTFTWTHNWKNCAPNNCGITSSQCSKTFSFTVTGTTATTSPTTNPTTNPTSNPTTTSSVYTVSYKIGESPTDLDTAPALPYTATPTIIDYTLKDQTPGQHFIWVEFIASSGETKRETAPITVLGPDPVITGCDLSFDGSKVTFNITGTNLGSTAGTIKSDTNNLIVKTWKDTAISATWDNPPAGETFPLNLTRSDNQTTTGQCSSISQLALGAKIFCRAPQQHTQDSVNLSVAEATEGARVTKQVVSIDKNGVVQGLSTKLESGKTYKLSLEAPKSLRVTTEFVAQEGTTNVPNFILPTGDIFPLDGGDGTINSLDKSELNREWIIASAAQNRPGDFNLDTRVNSIDWACMRYDFGESDQKDL